MQNRNNKDDPKNTNKKVVLCCICDRDKTGILIQTMMSSNPNQVVLVT